MVEVGERYRHFKGKGYEVVAIGWNSGSLKKIVVYRGDYDDDEFGFGQIWIRDVGDFCGFKILEDGRKVKRFEFVGDEDD